MFRFLHFNSVFVHIKCTSSMATRNDDNVNDVTASHVYEVQINVTSVQRISACRWHYYECSIYLFSFIYFCLHARTACAERW